jgi:2-dehydropantoate 2-reductase
MAQDMAKGRRTEIEFLNGFVVHEGHQVDIAARANERLVDIVKRVERGDLKTRPAPHYRATAELTPARHP